MGLDMYVRAVRKWDIVDLEKFGKKIINSMNINVNSNEDVSFDLHEFVRKNPTVMIPFGVGSELCYWRKHPNLHGWMKDLFYEKGGNSDSGFNGDIVFLTREDVLKLKEQIEKHTLPDTAGFFFGESYIDDEEREWRDIYDMECIEKMLAAIDSGDLIYYSSSW